MNVVGFSFIGVFLFSIGVLGILSRKNIFIIYLCIELMLNGVNIIFVAFSRYYGNMDGQIVGLVIIAIAAAESVVFLSIMALLFKKRGSLSIDILSPKSKKKML